jgi:hypothetical protein
VVGATVESGAKNTVNGTPGGQTGATVESGAKNTVNGTTSGTSTTGAGTFDAAKDSVDKNQPFGPGPNNENSGFGTRGQREGDQDAIDNANAQKANGTASSAESGGLQSGVVGANTTQPDPVFDTKADSQAAEKMLDGDPMLEGAKADTQAADTQAAEKMLNGDPMLEGAKAETQATDNQNTMDNANATLQNLSENAPTQDTGTPLEANPQNGQTQLAGDFSPSGDSSPGGDFSGSSDTG